MTAFLSTSARARPDILVSLILLLHRSRDPLDRCVVEDLLVPPVIRRVSDKSLGPLEATIRVADSLDLVHWADHKLSLTPRILSLEAAVVADHSPVIVREQLFDRNRLGPLFEGEDKGRDLVQAASWFLMQNTWNPATDYPGIEKLQMAQLLEDQRVMNSTKWPIFQRWAAWLGLGHYDAILANGALVPDPIQLVRDEIGNLSEAGQTWGASDFIRSLSERCPVLDGGSLRIDTRGQVADLSAIEWEPDPASVSPSLSATLLRLEHEKRLDMDNPADSAEDQKMTLTLAAGTTRVVASIRSLVTVS